MSRVSSLSALHRELSCSLARVSLPLLATAPDVPVLAVCRPTWSERQNKKLQFGELHQNAVAQTTAPANTTAQDRKWLHATDANDGGAVQRLPSGAGHR
ncbi:unnamed protein product [Lampetra planeri]